MKHKNKILITALALMVILPAVLFFSWLNASGEEIGSVEANLFSLADFGQGAMLSASCEAGVLADGTCQWSSGAGTQTCEATSSSISELYWWDANTAEKVANAGCRNIDLSNTPLSSFTVDHPLDDGSTKNAAGGWHYQDCVDCGGTTSCNMTWSDDTTEVVLNGGHVDAYSVSNPSCDTLCIPEERICTNGSLSGTYRNKSCTFTPCVGCVSTCNAADQICKGKTCTACGIITTGTKQCGWQEVAP